jgi:hypothetical protein
VGQAGHCGLDDWFALSGGQGYPEWRVREDFVPSNQLQFKDEEAGTAKSHPKSNDSV